MLLLYNSLNGNILLTHSRTDNIKELYHRGLSGHIAAVNSSNIIVNTNSQYAEPIEMFGDIYTFPGAKSYKYNNPYNTACVDCNYSPNEGCCKQLQYNIDDIDKYYVDITSNTLKLRPQSSIELWDNTRNNQFVYNNSYEAITINSNDNNDILIKVIFNDTIDNIIFKVNVTHGVCQKIITDNSNIIWIPYNITNQIGMICRIDVLPILDGNTQSYIPFIPSKLEFSLIQ